MTPTTIIQEAQADGVRLSLCPTGTIRATGDQAAVSRWLPSIRKHKADIVDVLRSGDGDTAPPAKVSPDDTATASRWWLIHFVGLDPLECYFTDPATHAEILERHPDAVAAEPFEPTIRKPEAPMPAEAETTIRAWLELIGEIDPVVVDEVIDACRKDAEVLVYYLLRASE